MRRFREMQTAGKSVALGDTTADLEARDQRDSTRKDAPLRAAEDAMLLDTSALNRDEAIAEAIRLVEARLAQA